MIPVCDVDVSGAEAEVLAQIRAGNVAGGDCVPRFEELFSSAIGRRHGVAASSGTTALTLALRALELPKGSEVLIPDLTIISCAIACIENGLKPVPVEVHADTWMMDVDDVKFRLSEQTSAVMLVHLFGMPCDARNIMNALPHNVKVVEDFSQAIGSESDMGPCGSIGDVSVTSFYANKLITTGEGGMCLTDDDVLAAKMRWYRNLCFGEGGDRFLHKAVGQNWRMSNISAAIGIHQVEKIEERVRAKRRIADAYRTMLRDVAVSTLPPHEGGSWWMYPITLPRYTEARRVIPRLAEYGVEARPFFAPIHQQPALQIWGHFPIASEIARQGLYLPSGFSLTQSQISHVCDALRQALLDELSV